jgi:hypothetical protein
LRHDERARPHDGRHELSAGRLAHLTNAQKYSEPI